MLIPSSKAHRSKFLGFLKQQTSLIPCQSRSREQPELRRAIATANNFIIRRALHPRKPLAPMLLAERARSTWPTVQFRNSVPAEPTVSC